MKARGAQETIAIYGGRRARLRDFFYRGLERVGGLRRFRVIEWSRVQRLVFVCKGNICRSPYAEARARAAGLASASFGLECAGGDRAHSRSIEAARARGIELGQHRTSRPEEVALGPHDLLVAMEPAHARRLAPLVAAAGAQLTLLGIWCRPARPYIHDPYGQDGAAFQACFSLIDRSVAELGARLAPLLSAGGGRGGARRRRKTGTGQ